MKRLYEKLAVKIIRMAPEDAVRASSNENEIDDENVDKNAWV